VNDPPTEEQQRLGGFLGKAGNYGMVYMGNQWKSWLIWISYGEKHDLYIIYIYYPLVI
jgi:hypothetical protein